MPTTRKELRDALRVGEQRARRVVQVQGFGHVQFVDLRRTLPNQAGVYRRWWANELHPTPDGFSLVAQRFAQAIGGATAVAPKSTKAQKKKAK